MKTLNASLILEKNQLYSDQPWIVLFEVDIDGTDYLRLAAYPEDISWNSLTWTKFPVVVESIGEEATGRLGGLNVHVANVNRMISAYVENNDLLGNDVTIYIVHNGNLDITSGVLSFTYRVNRIQVTEEAALFELGHEDLFALQLPWQRYIRNRCRFVYKDSQCGYPEDEFGLVSTENIQTGGDGSKGGGWTALNMANADVCDINTTSADELVMQATTGTKTWKDSNQDAPFIYKLFMGNWDFYAYRTHSAQAANDEGMFMVQSTIDYDDSIGMMNGYSGGGKEYVRSTTNGTSVDTEITAAPEWRITRAGSVFTFYNRNFGGSTWNQRRQETRSDMPFELRVGFVAATTGTAQGAQWKWAFFRANSGGLATCDNTLDGPNGCRIHANTKNFGGFPGIPYGRLYGI